MKEIYNKPRSNQKQEIIFQKYLLSNLKDHLHINQTYLLSEQEFLNPLINIRRIENLLLNFDKLSLEKKANVLSILNKLPDTVRVAEKNNLVSVDFLIIDENNKKCFIEFHEKQHRNLSVTRLTPIFDNKFNRYEIPRYVQRFLKDIWRIENLTNYKVVWFDWFQANQEYNAIELLSSEKKEFFEHGRFSFSSLIN